MRETSQLVQQNEMLSHPSVKSRARAGAGGGGRGGGGRGYISKNLICEKSISRIRTRIPNTHPLG